MIERRGRVVAVETDRLTVRFEGEAACCACRAAKVCAGGAPSRDLAVQRPRGVCVAAGDTVHVGVDEAAALAATALAYLVPLAGLIAATGLAATAGLPDPVIAGAAFAGLGAGFAFARRLARRDACRLQPVLLDEQGTDSRPVMENPR